MFRFFRCFAAGSIAALMAFSFASAEETQAGGMTIGPFDGGVRIAASPDAARVRLEVSTGSGALLYDSGWRRGNLLDWPVEDTYGHALSYGSYGIVVTASDLAGHVRTCSGTLQWFADGAHVDTADTATDPAAITRLFHDGDTGEIVTTVGDLAFRFGDVFARKDVEAMRLTPAGDLTVAGTIRAGRGIEMPDGSVLRTAGVISARDGLQPVTNVSGTGTTNALPKWTDTSGTLGDSAISEVGGRLGIGTLAPGTLLHVFGSATSDVFAGLGPNVVSGPAMNYGYSGNSFGRGSGFFNVRPDSSAVAPNPSLRFMTNNTQRIIITNAGNVGINTGFTGATAPTDRLEVAGNIRLVGPGTLLKFSDASTMSTAGATLGPNTFTGDQNVTGNIAATVGITAGTGVYSGKYYLNGVSFLGNPGIDNTFVGGGAGANTTGQSNVFVGALAGNSNTGGLTNTFVGWWAGRFNVTGQNNSYYGSEAGLNATSSNNALFGTSAGYTMTGGGDDSFFGEGAGYYANGPSNVYVGTGAGYGSSGAAGSQNAAIGAYAGYSLSSGGNNVLIGFGSGYDVTTGTGNTFVGLQSGLDCYTGQENTLVGDHANVANGTSNATAIGYKAYATDNNTLILGAINTVNTATSNTKVGIGTTHPQQMLSIQGGLNIDQGNANNYTFGSGATVLSFGNLSGEGIGSNRNVGTNQDGLDIYTNFTPRVSITQAGRVGIGGYPGAYLEVAAGLNTLADAWTTRSSARFKTNIEPIDSALLKTERLRGVTFDYRDSGRHSVGFIAEEVANVLPEAVERDTNGEIVGLDYNRITPLLVESVKSLQRENEELRARLDRLERMIAPEARERSH